MFSFLKWILCCLTLILPVLSDGCKTSQIIDWQKGRIYRFAGTGVPGYSGDGGLACSAKLNGPAGLAIDKEGSIYIKEVSRQGEKIKKGQGFF